MQALEFFIAKFLTLKANNTFLKYSEKKLGLEKPSRRLQTTQARNARSQNDYIST